MSKNKKAFERLVEAVVVVQEITCSKCYNSDMAAMMDEDVAAEYFQKKGWHATENNVYCPECETKRSGKGKKKDKKPSKPSKSISVTKSQTGGFFSGTTSFSPVSYSKSDTRKKAKSVTGTTK